MSNKRSRKMFIAPYPRSAQQYLCNPNDLDWEENFSMLVEEKDAIEKEHGLILYEMATLEQKRAAILKRAEDNESKRMQMKAKARTITSKTITLKSSKYYK